MILMKLYSVVSPQKASPGISQRFGGLDGRSHSDNLSHKTYIQYMKYIIEADQVDNKNNTWDESLDLWKDAPLHY